MQTTTTTQTTALYPELEAYLDARAGEFEQIPAERAEQLQALGAFIKATNEAAVEAEGGLPAGVNLICTHNSRRSHMGQLWCAAAAAKLGVPLRTYSGGTEATAFNARSVASLSRAGFRIEQTTFDSNPVYHTRFSDDAMPVTGFSKVYNTPPNPADGFIAVMVCSNADGNCPIAHGAIKRFALPFVDPKAHDDTPEEAIAYNERSMQIAREFLYVMTHAK